MTARPLTAFTATLALLLAHTLAPAGNLCDDQYDEVHDGPRLVISGECPGTIHVEWEQAAANRRMVLLIAASTGESAIPTGQPCAGTRLGLSSTGLRLVTTLNSGSKGRGQVDGTVADLFCGHRMQLIVAEGRTCSTSNVATIPGR